MEGGWDFPSPCKTGGFNPIKQPEVAIICARGQSNFKCVEVKKVINSKNNENNKIIE